MLALPLAMALKRWVAEATCIIIALLFLYRSVRSHDWRWLKEPVVLITFSLWVYSIFIVTPFAIDQMLSLSRAGWVRYVLMLAAIVYWLSDYRDEVKRVAFYTLLFLIFVVVDTLVQYHTGVSMTGRTGISDRLTGPFQKVIVGIYLAKMSLPCIGILLYYAWVKRNIPQMVALIAVMTGVFTCILLSNERTATITFIAAMGVIGLVLFIKIKPLRLWICVVALLQIAVMFGVYHSQERIQNRASVTHEMMNDFWNSPYGQLWKASYLTWKEHPISGAGMKNFRIACPMLMESQGIHYCDLHSHNVYLEFLSEMGIVGLLGLLALIVSMAFMILRERTPHNQNGYIVTMFAMANIVINFFPFAASQSIFANWPGILAWQSLAWALAVARSEGKRRYV